MCFGKDIPSKTEQIQRPQVCRGVGRAGKSELDQSEAVDGRGRGPRAYELDGRLEFDPQ